MAAIAPRFRSYIRKTLDLLGDRDPLRVQRTTPSRLRRSVAGLSSRELGWNPAPGKWSIRQIVAHLADTEMVYGYRLRRILADPGRPIEAYDQDVWARQCRYPSHSVARDLDYLESMRRMNLEFFARLQPREWELAGVHTERGRESIRQVCLMIAGHDLNHLGQIQAIRRCLGERRSR